MTAAAAVDRVVHHSVILELDVASYRAEQARQRLGEPARPADRRPAQDAAEDSTAQIRRQSGHHSSG